MPTYEYYCEDCGEFSAMRSIAQRNEPCSCPTCGTSGFRIVSTAPALATMDGTTRTALQRNELASNRPMTSAEYAAKKAEHKHGPGCGCGNSKLPSATIKTKDGGKMAPSKRPWMISH